MSAGGDDETAAKPIVDDTVAKPAGPLEDLPGQEGIAASASEEEPKETEEQRKKREAEEDKKFAKFRGGADPAAAYMANMAAMSSSAATTSVPLGPSGGMPDAVKKYYQTMYGDKWDQQKDPAQGKGTEVIDLINKAKTGRDLVGIVKDRVTSMSGEALWEGVFALSERCTASQKRDLANGKLGLQLSQRMREAMKNLDVNTWIENDTIGRGMYGLAKLNLHMKDRRAYSNVARVLRAQDIPRWSGQLAVHVIWALAKAECVVHEKELCQAIAHELHSKPGRLNHLSVGAMCDLLWGISRKSKFTQRNADNTTTAVVRQDGDDLMIFQRVAEQMIEKAKKLSAAQVRNVVSAYATYGVKNKELFNALCPVIIDKQSELSSEEMAEMITAYGRFSIPLKLKSGVKRTANAIQQTGDFQRPSRKPSGPEQLNIPIANKAGTRAAHGESDA